MEPRRLPGTGTVTGTATWRQFQINGNCLAALCNFHAVFHGSVKMSNNNGMATKKKKQKEKRPNFHWQLQELHRQDFHLLTRMLIQLKRTCGTWERIQLSIRKYNSSIKLLHIISKFGIDKPSSFQSYCSI